MLQKFRKNRIKNQRNGTFRNHQSGVRGPPTGTQAATWRGLGSSRAGGEPGPLEAPLAAPLCLFILRVAKPLKTETLFAISPLFRRRRASKIGSASKTLPGTLPEGGLTSESFPSTMDASWMIRE